MDLVLHQVAQEKSAGGPGSCGDLVNASFGCDDYACGTCAASDFQTCIQSATFNECKAYADAVSSTTGACAVLQSDAGAASSCYPQTSVDVKSFLNVFCGTGP